MGNWDKREGRRGEKRKEDIGIVTKKFTFMVVYKNEKRSRVSIA